MAIFLPPIDPVAFSVGPLEVRWYALSYLVGFLLGWKYCLYLVGKSPEGQRPNSTDVDDFLTWAVIGVILGGRLGYVLFYQSINYMADPLEVLKIWHGGMSFHGGAVGVIMALLIFARRRKISLLRLSDVVCAAVPIGLFFGRIANFINAELVGRPTTVPWGVVYPHEVAILRHPSQIYEAILEGAVLFLILFFVMRSKVLREKAGLTTGLFLAGYGIFRTAVEFTRQPDVQLGFIMDAVTMGQILSLPMIIVGVGVCVYSLRSKPQVPASHA